MTEQEASAAEDVQALVEGDPEGQPDAVEAHEEQPQEAEERQVPLSALEAERKKRQEEALRRQQAEQQAYLIQQQIAQSQSKAQDDEDDYTKGIKNYAQTTAQQQIQNAMEQMYIQQNPGIVDRLQNELPELYSRRPELKYAVMNSPNRVLAAAQLLDDYAPRKTVASGTRQKIEENQKKPRSPHGSGKTAKLSKADMISKMSSEEFHRYREELLRRR